MKEGVPQLFLLYEVVASVGRTPVLGIKTTLQQWIPNFLSILRDEVYVVVITVNACEVVFDIKTTLHILLGITSCCFFLRLKQDKNVNMSLNDPRLKPPDYLWIGVQNGRILETYISELLLFLLLYDVVVFGNTRAISAFLLLLLLYEVCCQLQFRRRMKIVMFLMHCIV